MSGKNERLLIASDKLAEAARSEGIDPGSPLWVWVEAQQHALHAIYEWQTSWSAAINAEIDKLRAAQAAAETQRRRVDVEIRRMEINQKDLETKTVKSLTDAVATKLKEVLVIRERRWNQKARAMSWIGAGSLMLGLVIGGYTWRALQDSDAVAAQSRCFKESVKDSVTGKLFCPVEVMLGDS